jgi:hypothetical protein
VTDSRSRLLRAALGFALVRADQPELRSKQECERAIMNILATFIPSATDCCRQQEPSRGEVYVTYTLTKKDPWTQGFRYLCLPDTVDPRAPKGR